MKGKVMDRAERLRCYMYLKHTPLKIGSFVGSGFAHRHNIYLVYTCGTPEVCQLPAGMAEKNKLVLYPLYVILKKQYNNRAAVRQ